MHHIGLHIKLGPGIILGHALCWGTHHIRPHIKLVHVSNRPKCKKFTKNDIGHASNGLKCKKVTIDHTQCDAWSIRCAMRGIKIEHIFAFPALDFIFLFKQHQVQPTREMKVKSKLHAGSKDLANQSNKVKPP